MYAYHRVNLLFAQCAHQVVGSFLHLRVGPLHGIQFDTVGVASRIYRRHRAAAQTDAVIVTAYDHYLVAFLRLTLQAVALGAVSDTSGKHDYLVVGVLFFALLVLKREHRAADERLAELVAEVACAI